MILDEESKEPIEAEIQLNTISFSSSAKTDSDGKFKILAPTNSNVDIEVVAKGHFIETNTLKIGEEHSDKFLKIPLPRIEIGKKFTFKNMLFKGNKSIMLARSYPVLDHLKRFMFVNTDQCIEIAGHVNLPSSPKVSRSDGYFELSIARSLVVHNELVRIGVQKDRLLAKGYGNWEMLFPFAKSEAHQEKNRRVEIIIAHCDSTKLLANDKLDNLDFYSKVNPADRKYSEEYLEIDLKYFPDKAKKDIKHQVRRLLKKGMDPTKYSYKELLQAFPDLPEKK